MSETKWTPGKWRIGDGQHSNSYRYEVETVSPRGRRIVVARIPTPKGSPEQATANAALLAAAPLMFEALVSVLGCRASGMSHSPCNECTRKIDAALAAARGAP